MPPRKHQRSASDPSSNAGLAGKASKIVKVERSNTLPRATFQDLPFELRKTILDLACSRSLSKGDKDASLVNAARRIRLDSNTLFNLILVSREFYATLKPTLWRHVKLVRPSQLAEFREALVRIPANGELVRSLHVGPLSDLPRGWWPVRAKKPDQAWNADGSLVLLRTSLGDRDEAMRPLWCKPHKEWAFCLTARTCQGGAVAEAIYAALKGVDISLGDQGYEPYQFGDHRGHDVGINDWTLRLFELQGALDLYLAEMRRLEQASSRTVVSWKASKTHPVGKDPRDCCRGKCAHYPRLVLEGFEGHDKKAKKRQPEDNTFFVTQAEVRKHLTRRGAPTDNFEHPIVFAQCDLRLLAASHDGAIRVDYERRRANSFYGSIDSDDESYDPDDVLLRYNDDDFSQPTDLPLRPRSPTDSEGSAHDTFDLLQYDGISALANSVLRRTPKVVNLSLTGFLACCLQPPKPPLLTTLRCLSLGPPASPPGATLDTESLSLPMLEKFRFCGDFLETDLARRISGQDGNWSKMRETQWDFGSSSVSTILISMLHTVYQLQGRKDAQAPAPHPGGQQSTLSGDDALTEDEVNFLSKVKPSTQSHFTEARIHPKFLPRVLDMAPSPRERRAWQHGLPVSDAPHRVRLVESRAANTVPDNDRWTPRPRQDYEVLRADSEKWWEECAWQLEHEGWSSSE